MSAGASGRRRNSDDRPAGSGGDRRIPDARPDTRRRALILCGLAFPVLLGFYAMFLWWSLPHTAGDSMTIDGFSKLVRQGRVHDAVILESDHRITGRYDGGRYWVAYPGGTETLLAKLLSELDEAAVSTRVEQQPLKALIGPITVLLPALVLVDGMVLVFLLVRPDGDRLSAFGTSRGKRAAPAESATTFGEVAGLEEAIEELSEVRDFLADPRRFQALGATVPKGILLTGPPGCGKTLLARALAGDSKVPFFSISGSDFVEMFVGVGAARIRDLFRVAKAAAPSIVFIDELDAVGRGRTVVATGGTDEREATLGQLLVEMDGFEPGSGVVVLGATNRPDILDTALLRPGRFDRHLSVERPDVRGRRGILEIHARGKPLSSDVDLDVVARRTPGFSGADLANVVNEAALLAARERSDAIRPSHLMEAVERAVSGPERRSRLLSPDDRRRIAVHEAGHAVVAASLPGTETIAKLSIVGRAHTAAATWWITDSDRVSVTRAQLVERMAVLLGGRAAEERVLGAPSSGAAADLSEAVALARRTIADFGLGSLRALSAAHLAAATPAVSPPAAVAAETAAEVQELMHEAGDRASALVAAHGDVVLSITDALVRDETVEGAALEQLLFPLSPAPSPAAATGGL